MPGSTAQAARRSDRADGPTQRETTSLAQRRGDAERPDQKGALPMHKKYLLVDMRRLYSTANPILCASPPPRERSS
jgi:hypothetical protein